jgi:hypothetical protein
MQAMLPATLTHAQFNCSRTESMHVPLCFAEIGLGLTGFGILFTILGMIMLFDKGLIAMGNVGSTELQAAKQPTALSIAYNSTSRVGC